jgi:hypothetical protein
MPPKLYARAAPRRILAKDFSGTAAGLAHAKRKLILSAITLPLCQGSGPGARQRRRRMVRKNVAVSAVLYAASSLLLIILLGPIGAGIAAVMGFLIFAGFLSALSKK